MINYPNLKKNNLKSNAASIEGFGDIPDVLKITITEDLDEGRLLVFSTRRNVEILVASQKWYLNETLKVSPLVFMKLFTVLGT